MACRLSSMSPCLSWLYKDIDRLYSSHIRKIMQREVSEQPIIVPQGHAGNNKASSPCQPALEEEEISEGPDKRHAAVRVCFEGCKLVLLSCSATA